MGLLLCCFYRRLWDLININNNHCDYYNSCYGGVNAVVIVIVTMVTLHTVAIVNYMLLLIISLLVFCDFIGTIAFEIYKSS